MYFLPLKCSTFMFVTEFYLIDFPGLFQQHCFSCCLQKPLQLFPSISELYLLLSCTLLILPHQTWMGTPNSTVWMQIKTVWAITSPLYTHSMLNTMSYKVLFIGCLIIFDGIPHYQDQVLISVIPLCFSKLVVLFSPPVLRALWIIHKRKRCTFPFLF